jgi:hypothetical protein
MRTNAQIIETVRKNVPINKPMRTNVLVMNTLRTIVPVLKIVMNNVPVVETEDKCSSTVLETVRTMS